MRSHWWLKHIAQSWLFFQHTQSNVILYIAGSSSGNIEQPPRFISEAALDRVKASSFLISHIDARDTYVGIGVFVTRKKAVTAKHNLGSLSKGSTVQANFELGSTMQMTIVSLGQHFDYAILESETEHDAHLDTFKGDFEKLAGTDLILCGFLIGIKEHLPEFSLRVKAMKASVMDVSQNKHHILYGTIAFPGDSGGALVVWDGQLVGIHIDGVNALQAQYEREKSLDVMVEDMQDSLENLACSVSDGFVGLLVNAFDFEFV